MSDARLLFVSNLMEVFGSATSSLTDPRVLLPMRLAYKSTQCADPAGPDYALLAQHAPEVPERYAPFWRGPARTFAVGDHPQPCTEAAKPPMLEAIIDWIGPSPRLEITATVHSEALQRLVLALAARLPRLDIDGLPTAPAGLIRRLNTKTGGRDLMRRALIPEVELAPQTLFPTLDAALRWLGGATGSNPYMIKANGAIGGFGVVLFRPGRRLDEADLESLRGRRRHAESWKAIGSVDDGVVVERVVGNFDTNWSVTADFEVTPGTMPSRLIGMADQVLKGRVSYRGLQSTPEDGWRRAEPRIAEIGRSLGDRLSRSGYRGLLNIDVVVPRDPAREGCYLIEVNLRRSAPLNSFLLLQRLHGPGWREHVHVHVVEDERITGRITALATLLDALDRSGFAFSPTSGYGILPYSIDPVEGRFAGMIMAPDAATMTRSKRGLAELLSHA